MSVNSIEKSIESQVPPNLQKYLENIIEKEGYLTYDVVMNEIFTNGRSYLGKPLLISIKGKTKQGEKTTEVFVKSIVELGDFGETLDLPLAFTAEAFVYNELSKIFNELQKEAGIPIEDRYKIIKSYDVSHSEAIFLENVVVKGFNPCHKAKVMDMELAEMALKEMAKFHALSFVIKENRPEFYKNVLEKIKHPFIYGTAWEEVVFNFSRQILQYLDGTAKEKMELFIPKVASKIEEILTPNPTSTLCLVHGDFRLPNLMMKYDGEKLKDLYVVDYQLIQVGCPVNDFMYFVFTGTDQEFRRKHMKHLKEFYYKSLAEYLKRFNLDAEDLYPKEEFERDYLARLEYGLCVTCFFLQFFLAADDNLPGFTDQSANIAQKQLTLVEEGPKRLKEIVDDYIEWGLI